MVSIRKHAAKRLDTPTPWVGSGLAEYSIPTLPHLPKARGSLAEPIQRLTVDLALEKLSDRDPVPMGQPHHGKFPMLTKRPWLYRGDVYVVDDLELTSEDVLALIHEAQNKRRVRLEKAHAVAAMAEALADPKRRRPIPQDVRILVWKRDGGRCVECDSQENLEFDHIIPVAMGGANTDRNLQLLCQDCNRRKGASLG